MSNQPENEMQQSETITPQELREALLSELEASKQAIAELNDEQLEEIAGGAIGTVYHAPTISWAPKPNKTFTRSDAFKVTSPKLTRLNALKEDLLSFRLG
jgi:hypothetical protein